jgi:hypothetical protein
MYLRNNFFREERWCFTRRTSILICCWYILHVWREISIKSDPGQISTIWSEKSNFSYFWFFFSFCLAWCLFVYGSVVAHWRDEFVSYTWLFSSILYMFFYAKHLRFIFLFLFFWSACLTETAHSYNLGFILYGTKLNPWKTFLK